jgi:2-hydroxychromene-2-carboxylate isomerase
MNLSVDLFFSFRSPYSYLALPKTLKLVADYDATVNLRPVYPLAVRVPGFFKRANPQFARYVVLDSSRVAKHETSRSAFPAPIRSCRTWRRSMSRRNSPTSIA